MELTKINELLSNIGNPRSNKALRFETREEGHQGVSSNSYGGYHGVQGEYDSYSLIFKVVDETHVYLKFTYQTDSYGSNDFISSIQFVQPTECKVTDFEPVK